MSHTIYHLQDLVLLHSLAVLHFSIIFFNLIIPDILHIPLSGMPKLAYLPPPPVHSLSSHKLLGRFRYTFSYIYVDISCVFTIK